MRIFGNTNFTSAKAMSLLFILALFILALRECSYDPKPVHPYTDQTKVEAVIPTGPGLDLILLSLRNTRPFDPDIKVILNKDKSFKILKGKNKIEGFYEVYQVYDHENIIVFNSDGFKDTCKAVYIVDAKEKGFHFTLTKRTFLSEERYCQSGRSAAVEQLRLIKWQYVENKQGQGFITLKNQSDVTWDSFSICINGWSCDNSGIFRSNSTFRYPPLDWSGKKLAPGKSISIKLIDAVKEGGEKFRTSEYSVIQVYCKGKFVCGDGYIGTDYTLLDMASD